MDDSTKLRQGLHTMLTQAEIDFEMWQAMHKERRNKDLQQKIKIRYSRFYVAAETALFNSLIIILYKTVENRKDTININSYKKSLTDLIPKNTEFELDELEKVIEPLKTKISILRNNTVGHQSMKLSSGDAFDKVNLWATESFQLIEYLKKYVFILARDVQDTHIIFNMKGTKHFDNLVTDLTC
jgi:hypothetical protein